jgi:radical SAM superfamily enzyme YgiQ (UPF0313 family)
MHPKRPEDYTIEIGPMGPIGEGEALLLRVNRNCPWNQCVFCPAYKGTKFAKRSLEEIKGDIDSMAKEYGEYASVESVFLQDADSLLLPTPDLLEILKYDLSTGKGSFYDYLFDIVHLNGMSRGTIGQG